MTAPEIANTLLEFYRRDARRWTQGADARAVDGQSVGARNPGACCWCLAGAMLASGCRAPGDRRTFDDLMGNDCLVEWNDAPGRTFADVEARLKQIAGVA